MKLYELVNEYHVDTELSCAEAMFRACNEYYNLNLSDDARKMFSVMGIGMQSQISCCGAFTVAVGIIGLMTSEDGETDINNIRGAEMIMELTYFVLSSFGTLQCTSLQGIEITGFDNSCHGIVEIIARKLEEIISGEKDGIKVVVHDSDNVLS